MTEPQHDIHRLWRGQPREEHAMSIAQIRARADRFERKARQWNWVTALVLLAAVAGDAWQVWASEVPLIRVGNVLTIAAIAYIAYQYRGWVRTESMPAGLGLTASGEFYRRQLARHRDAANQPWRLLAPFVPGVALSLLGHTLDRSPAESVAIAAFGVGLFLAIAWWNRRTARTLQRAIDELS